MNFIILSQKKPQMQGFGTQWSLLCTQAWNICLAIMNQVAFPASELHQLSRHPCDVTEWWFMGSLLWWRHQMETFSALLVICVGNSPHKGQWRGALIFPLIRAWINGWVNNCETGDLRRHHAHYDVPVMLKSCTCHHTGALICKKTAIASAHSTFPK